MPSFGMKSLSWCRMYRVQRAADGYRDVGECDSDNDDRRSVLLRPTRDRTEWNDRKHATGQGELEPLSQTPIEECRSIVHGSLSLVTTAHVPGHGSSPVVPALGVISAQHCFRKRAPGGLLCITALSWQQPLAGRLGPSTNQFTARIKASDLWVTGFRRPYLIGGTRCNSIPPSSPSTFNIFSLILSMARDGDSPFGQTSVQFMIVRQRNRR